MATSVAPSPVPESSPLSHATEVLNLPNAYITQPHPIPAAPWETFRSKLSTKHTLCFALTLLLTLGGTILAGYAGYTGNWIICGIGLGIIVLTLILALLLAIPLKNKQTGTKLIDEISQDISSIGSGFVQRYGLMFSTIKSVHLPELTTQNQEKTRILNEIEAKKESIQNLELKITECQNKLAQKQPKRKSSQKSFMHSIKHRSKNPVILFDF
uniref:Uncharacterized protein CPn_0440/CP_0313/CPj0440/CpB0456 n=1 Tax=Chlamydia pneumoniae TaxID=83558 RepID=A0A0F7WQM9_CHLPN|nr:Uncharacterized protein CPn_0440/CP_0313/CPj0440/CpB0456 [Chlamydia pneumoniae]